MLAGSSSEKYADINRPEIGRQIVLLNIVTFSGLDNSVK